MALTASTLITTAKQRTFGVTGSQKVSDAMLLTELSYQDQLTVQLFSQIAPDLLATISGAVVFTDGGNTAGYSLKNGMHYRDFVHADVDNNKFRPINMVQRQHQQKRSGVPTGMLRIGTSSAVFYPVDPRRERWAAGNAREWFEPTSNHEMTYSYVSTPAALTAVSDTLASPDMAREVFVTALEVRILLSNPRQSEVWQLRVQAAVSALQAAQTSLQMQAYKLMQPQGQPGGSGSRQSDTNWVDGQVTG